MNVTRRTALASLATAAAGLVVPTLQLRATDPREAILKSFADTDFYARYDVNHPFMLDDLCYATNNREIIRGSLPLAAMSGQCRLPPVAGLFNQYFRPQLPWRPFSLPNIDSLTYHKGICPVCDDRRISYGEHYPASQEIMDSLPCYDVDDNTYRDPSCDFCHGRFGSLPSIFQPFENISTYFSYSRMKKIAAIPGVEVSYFRRRDPEKNSIEGFLLFRCHDFEGIACPVSS